MKKALVVSYKPRRTARLLAERLNANYIPLNSSQVPRTISAWDRIMAHTRFVLNWGTTSCVVTSVAKQYKVLLINIPNFVVGASNKPRALITLEHAGVPVPWYTTDRREAERKIEEGKSIVVRRYARASQGRGATLHSMNPLPEAVFYTEFINKEAEGRIHVFRGQVIDTVEKLRAKTAASTLCWNHANGYTFTHNLRHDMTDAKTIAIDAVGTLLLHFGAVDIILHDNKWYVLEVNTAPGLAIEQSLEAYLNAIKNYAERMGV